MDMEQIKCMLSVAKTLNFSESAFDLAMSQSNISKKIAKLENEFNTKLFHRSAKGVALTEAGKVYARYAERILKLYEQIQKEIVQDQSDMQQLIIGSTHFSQEQSLTPRIAAFSKRKPEINLVIESGTTEQLLERILNATMDIAFVVSVYRSDAINPLPNFSLDRRLITHSLAKDPYYLVVSEKHPLAKRNMIDYAELKQEKIITVGKVPTYYSAFNSIFESEGLTGNIAFSSSSIRDALMLVSENAGIGFFSSMVTSDFKNVVLVPMKMPLIRETQMIMLKQQKESRNARAFFDYFKSIG